MFGQLRGMRGAQAVARPPPGQAPEEAHAPADRPRALRGEGDATGSTRKADRAHKKRVHKKVRL